MLEFVPMGDVGDEMGKSYKLIRGLERREGGRGEGEGREGRKGGGKENNELESVFMVLWEWAVLDGVLTFKKICRVL